MIEDFFVATLIQEFFIGNIGRRKILRDVVRLGQKKSVDVKRTLWNKIYQIQTLLIYFQCNFDILSDQGAFYFSNPTTSNRA